MALCYVAWGIFFFFLYYKGVDHIRHYFWTATYFLSVAIGMSLLFWERIAAVLQPVALTPLVTFVVFMLCQVAWYIYFSKKFKEPENYFKTYPDRHYLRINWRRLVAKSADILAQQVFIVLLVLFLNDLGLTTYQLLLAFGVLFAALHIPLFVSEWGKWPAWVFGGAVAVFSVVYPLFILNVEYGFMYNIIVHWLFYTATATTFLWWHQKMTRGNVGASFN